MANKATSMSLGPAARRALKSYCGEHGRSYSEGVSHALLFMDRVNRFCEFLTHAPLSGSDAMCWIYVERAEAGETAPFTLADGSTCKASGVLRPERLFHKLLAELNKTPYKAFQFVENEDQTRQWFEQCFYEDGIGGPTS